MAIIKTDDEIELMKIGGSILNRILKEAIVYSVPGKTTLDIDRKIQRSIREAHAEAGFKKVEGYRWASCVCINEQIVHTPPSNREIRDGDVITIDMGVYYKGFHTDSAYTFQVGQKKNPEISKFLDTGKEILQKAIHVARPGKHIGHISEVIYKGITKNGYSVVKQLTGHGVGRELHERPQIPCFVDKPIQLTPVIAEGMTLAIELMYAMGSGEIEYEKDGWSIKMADNSISASFEHTVAIKKNKTLILT